MALSTYARRLGVTWREPAGTASSKDISLSAVLLFCALLFPFILSYHRFPIPSFYQEWLAIFLALAASILVAAKYRDERFELPLAASIPLVLLPSVLAHLTVGNDLITHGPLLYLIYIGSAFLFMIIGRKLGATHETRSLADVMAAAFVAGALLSSVASLHWRFRTGVFDPLPWGSEGGWIAQRNQNALHIWLGIIGICHFLLNGKVSWGYFLMCLGILVATAVHTESRSVYLYAGCGFVISAWAAVKSFAPDTRKRFLLIGVAPIIFLGASQVAPLYSDRDPGGDSSVNSGAIQRYAPATIVQDPRAGLWLTAVQITRARPWIGAGPGSYIRESWLLSDSLPSTVPTVIPSTHAHNLFLQIGAELGAPTVFALAALIGAWLMFALRQKDWQGKWLFVAIPMMILTHGQVEYSLWYLYFLVPAALSMGAATQRVTGKGLPGFAMLVAAVIGLGLAARLGQDYKTVEAVVASARSGHGEISDLLDVAEHPIFGAWASTEIAGNSWPTGITQQSLDEHTLRALFVSPLKKTALARHIGNLKNNGKSVEAATEQRIARRVFGGE